VPRNDSEVASGASESPMKIRNCGVSVFPSVAPAFSRLGPILFATPARARGAAQTELDIKPRGDNGSMTS
jgi:hypothetical protein